MPKNLGVVREKWLEGGDTDLDHERFAAAMMKCQHDGGFCASDGFCHFSGDCFRSVMSSANEAARMIRSLQSDSDVVQGWLNDAADFIVGEARK